MNIEHIWANSWWGHVVNNAYCDLFNLFPSDAEANRHKSNNPIGVVDGRVAWDNDVIKVGTCNSYLANRQVTVWEPSDEWKGDFARTYFYMATCYQHMHDLWCTTEGLLTVNPESDLLLQPEVSQMMLTWANEDPVDEIETERNRVIHEIQGNRNPFVDYPTLSTYIWGDSTTHVFYIDKESESVEMFVPEAEAELNFGLQPLSKGFETSLTIRGRNFTDGTIISVDNPEQWLLCKLNFTDEEKIKAYYEKTKGMKYDLRGALGVVLGFRQKKNRYFCSEWCFNALEDSEDGWRFSPNHLEAVFRNADLFADISNRHDNV